MTKINNLSIVIPVFNEDKNVKILIEEIYENLDQFNNFELLIVNDGSTDETAKVIKNLKKKYHSIVLINNKKNEGQSKSLHTGILNSKYDNICTMDGDLQNDPKDIIKIYEIYVNKNLSLVGGIRNKRKDSKIKIYASKIANSIRSFLLNDKCKDTGCGLKIFKKDVYINIPFFDGQHRFLPAFFIGFGKETLYVNVNHRHRKYGKSKYGILLRTVKGIYDIFRVLILIQAKKNEFYK